MSEASAKDSARVLITGVTGFLGKVVLEEVCRQAGVLDVGEVIVVVRPKRGERAADRFRRHVLESPCFSLTRPDWSEGVTVVSGDLAEPRCGLDERTYDGLCARVTHVLHCAASSDADLGLRDAVAANVDAALRVLELARDCRALHRLVVTSTAYVTPHRAGPIGEELAPLPRPAEELYREAWAEGTDAAALLRETGHPSAHTLTRCLAEHLLVERRGAVPLTLVRPSTLSASWRYPFAGWIDGRGPFAAFVSTLGAGLLQVVNADPAAVLDLVPVDEVAARLVDQAFLSSAPRDAVPIVYAVAGKALGAPMGEICDAIVRYYESNGTTARPRLRYVGRPTLSYRIQRLLHQDGPAALASSYFRLRGDTGRCRNVERGSATLRAIDRVFPYFTHRTFDFRPSVPIRTDFDAAAYVQAICWGVQTYLLRTAPPFPRESQPSLVPPSRPWGSPSPLPF